jgi:uncharacterized protein
MKFGLSEEIIGRIDEVFRKFPEVELAILYGSRAKGNFNNNSDIDITLYGDINHSILNKIIMRLDDLMLPYTFDLSIYKYIKDPDMLEHITRVGIVFYEKKG